jgi:hypothetical protein
MREHKNKKRKKTMNDNKEEREIKMMEKKDMERPSLRRNWI